LQQKGGLQRRERGQVSKEISPRQERGKALANQTIENGASKALDKKIRAPKIANKPTNLRKARSLFIDKEGSQEQTLDKSI
jgi:hypothetical protein